MNAPLIGKKSENLFCFFGFFNANWCKENTFRQKKCKKKLHFGLYLLNFFKKLYFGLYNLKIG